MDTDLWVMLFKILVTLPFILGLIYISLKYGGTKLQQMQNGRFIKVLEKVQLSKENSIMVIKMGEKVYAISSTSSKIEILKELQQDEIIKLEETKTVPQYNSLRDLYYNIKTKRKMQNDKKQEN
jgi:flagellar protein FliO/FliZ